jgi:hypothetical protein
MKKLSNIIESEKWFMVSGTVMQLVHFEKQEENILLQFNTEKGNIRKFTVSESGINKFIAEMLPTENKLATLPKKETQQLASVANKLFNALDRVMEDPAYIAQAEQMCRISQTLINLAKVQIEASKL